MFMKSRLLVATCGCLILLAHFDTSQAATWGAEVSIYTLSPCPSYCGGPGGVYDFSSDGGEFTPSAFTSLSNTDGNGQAGADLSGPTSLPVLRAGVFSGPDSYADSSAVGMLGYTFTGSSATTLSLDIMLDGEVGGTTNPSDAWARSDVAVILGGVNYFASDKIDLDTLWQLTPALSELGSSNLTLDLGAGPQTKTDSINFTLNPGDKFFVWAGLEAAGMQNGFGDVSNTLSMSFSADTDISTVPLPAAVYLFGSGLLGLIGVMRRKAT
jgi:hypothetical protein